MCGSEYNKRRLLVGFERTPLCHDSDMRDPNEITVKITALGVYGLLQERKHTRPKCTHTYTHIQTENALRGGPVGMNHLFPVFLVFRRTDSWMLVAGSGRLVACGLHAFGLVWFRWAFMDDERNTVQNVHEEVNTDNK